MSDKITIFTPTDPIMVAIRELITTLKNKRNNIGHDDPIVDTWTLRNFEKETSKEVRDLLTLIAPLRSITQSKLDEELKNIKTHLKNIIDDVQNKEQMVKIMKEELIQIYQPELDLRFKGNYNPDDARSGSLKNYVLPRFLKGDQEISYSDLLKEIEDRPKTLLIEGQAGMGKTSLTW